MISAHEVARFFICMVDEDAGDSISNLKLQKLLYYAQGVHLAITDTPLFREKVVAWMHGPVVVEVYEEYKVYGSGAIPRSVAAEGAEFEGQILETLEEVQAAYGQFTATKLRNMTHAEPPWMLTPRGEEISHKKMRDYFITQLIDQSKDEP